MINLQKISGLPILFDEKKMALEFHGDFPFIKKSERTLDELRPYLKNPDVKNWSNPVYHVRNGVSNVVYYVWRYVHLKKDALKLKESNLRYDLTLIPPGEIDSEFSKTAGHFHKNKINTELPYPEMYEVLTGRAYFLIQSPEKDLPASRQDTKNIKAVRLIEAGPGEKVLVPPQFSGHTIINAFNEPLIMANWISDQAVYDYNSYKNNHGASYYLLNNDNLIDIVKNLNYNYAPEIQKIRIKEYPKFGLVKNQPIYSLVNDLEKLRFLNYPEKFAGEWVKSERASF